ncbi:hypothetical protein RJ639_031981 [Escallonia herrerae]|uniref:Glycosyltransferase N-terminal domain-containing protein n=1 Tax=Escallonia herrerae TaxID=1293975 RepID=A0AA89BI86_9ASTE|nr:hypothetical protein RJ639_031981 [Escallonia herrerae]
MEVPHVVILPFPVQGHIKPMFNLSKLLCHAGFDVTLVNSYHNQVRILNLIDQYEFQSQFPRLRFVSISDGLPSDHPRAGPQATDLFGSTVAVSKPEFRDLIVSLVEEEKAPTCIVADGIMSFAVDVAEEFQIHAITFRTYNATCTWVCFHLQKLVHNGEIPFQENEDMERQITCKKSYDAKIFQVFADSKSNLKSDSSLRSHSQHLGGARSPNALTSPINLP